MAPAQPLLIGIGNRLRSDDGAGILLAEQVAEQLPGLEVLLCDQLTPELAARISQVPAVLFVDAVMPQGNNACSATAGQPQLEPLHPAAGGNPGGHALTPAQVLALCAALYGLCPPAWQLLLPGERWEVGDQLSGRAAAACRRALPLVQAWGEHHA